MVRDSVCPHVALAYCTAHCRPNGSRFDVVPRYITKRCCSLLSCLRSKAERRAKLSQSLDFTAMEPQIPTPSSILDQDSNMSFLSRTLASTSTLRAARSVSSTSVPSIVNRLPEPHPNPEHPPRTNEGLRVCQVISVKPERLEEYEQVHREVWPGVLNALRRANVVGE